MLASVERAAGGALAEAKHAVIVLYRQSLRPHASRRVVSLAGCSIHVNVARIERIYRRPLPPLLEKERDASCRALIARAPEPIRMRGPRLRPAFTAGDEPMKRTAHGPSPWPGQIAI